MPSDRKPPELRAPEQNAFLGAAARGVANVEDLVDRYFELPLDLFLPVSSEFLEKASYGDPLFRMPTQSNIPITADREYLMEAILGPALYTGPAAKGLGRAAKSAIKPTRPRLTEEELSYILNGLEVQRFAKGGGVKRGIDYLAEVLKGGSKPTDTKRRAALGLPNDLTPKPGEVVVKEEVKTAPKKGETLVSMTEAMNVPMSRRDVLRAGTGQALSAMAPRGAMGALMKAAASPAELMKQAVAEPMLTPAKKALSSPMSLQGLIAKALKEGEFEDPEEVMEYIFKLNPRRRPRTEEGMEDLEVRVMDMMYPDSYDISGVYRESPGPLELMKDLISYEPKQDLRQVLRQIRAANPEHYEQLKRTSRDIHGFLGDEYGDELGDLIDDDLID